MNKIPSLIIVTNRGHLVAYRPTDTGSLQRIDSAEFSEGTDKISEIVTDQSGAFPMTGSQGTGSYESLPFVAELEVRCFRRIAEKIGEIIDREKPASWGFATPSEINGAIIDHLDPKYQKQLSRNLKLDLTNSSPADVGARFEKAAAASLL
jgi:hypothetical protein